MLVVVAAVMYLTLALAVANRVVSRLRPAWSSWPPPDDGRVLPALRSNEKEST